MSKTDCQLIIDAREGSVTKYAATELAGVQYEITTITVGDYIVRNPVGRVVAILERKTLPDFAASIKDGRINNIDKLRALSQDTGCRILYILEGPHVLDPTTTYSGIRYGSIESHLFHLAVRDGVCVLRTLDAQDTARTLARFTRSMDTLYRATTHAGGAQDQQQGGATPNSRLTVRTKPSDAETVVKMWCCYAAVADTTARLLSARWTLLDVLEGRVTEDHLRQVRNASGRAISADAIRGVLGAGRDVHICMLARIPMVSLYKAAAILEQRTLLDLLQMPQKNIEDIRYREDRRLGPATAAAIVRLFRTTCAPSGAPQSTQTTQERPPHSAQEDAQHGAPLEP